MIINDSSLDIDEALGHTDLELENRQECRLIQKSGWKVVCGHDRALRGGSGQTGKEAEAEGLTTQRSHMLKRRKLREYTWRPRKALFKKERTNF